MSTVRFMLLTLALAGVCAPLLGTAEPCAEAGDPDTCDVDCAMCLCCSHAPQATIHIIAIGFTAEGSSELGANVDRLSPAPLPWEILHVPRPPAGLLTSPE